MERRQVRHKSTAPHQGKQFCTVGELAGRRSPGCGDRRRHLSPQRHDRREPKEEIARLNALGERLANGLREAYDTDALKEVRPVGERGD
jgi:hypothetical protein